MPDSADLQDPQHILAAVAQVQAREPASAETLKMAAMLADWPLPLDFTLAMDGADHNPALINPAAAMFASMALLNPLFNSDLILSTDEDRAFQIRPEVRQALHEAMTPEERQEWAGRAAYALNLVLPDAEPQNWPVVEYLMPHVLACRDLAAMGLATAATNRVLHQAGFSLHLQNRHRESAELLHAALAVDVAIKGEGHPDIPTDWEGLGMVLWSGGDLAAAQAAFAACLDLQQKIYTEDNPVSAPVLNSLAVVQQNQGLFAEAEASYRRCMDIIRKNHGEIDPTFASCLGNLALLLEAMDRPDEALEAAKQAWTILTRIFGPDHPDVAEALNTMALLNESLGNHQQAEILFRQSLELRSRLLGPDHPVTAQTMCNLALLLDGFGRAGEAMEFYEKGLAIYQQTLGPDHPYMESALDNYLGLLERTGLRSRADAMRRGAEDLLRKIVEQ